MTLPKHPILHRLLSPAAALLTLLLCGPVSTVRAAWGWKDLSAPTSPGQFYDPTQIARDASGNLYLYEYGFFPNPEPVALQRRSPDGEWTVLAGRGKGPGQVDDVQDMAVDASGNLYLAEQKPSRIVRRTPDGKWSDLSAGRDGISLISTPVALAVAKDGTLFVAQWPGYDPNHPLPSLLKRDPDGNWTPLSYNDRRKSEVTAGIVHSPVALAASESGDLYVIETDGVQARDRDGRWRVLFYIPRDYPNGLFYGDTGDNVEHPQDGFGYFNGILGADGKLCLSGAYTIGDGTPHGFDQRFFLQKLDPAKPGPVKADSVPPEGIWLEDSELPFYDLVSGTDGSLFATQPHFRFYANSFSFISRFGYLESSFSYTPGRHPQAAIRSWDADGREGPGMESLAPLPNQFRYPTDLDVDSTGNVYVVDPDHYRVQQRDPDGVWTTLAIPGDGPGQVNIPERVEVYHGQNGAPFPKSCSDALGTVYIKTRNFNGSFTQRRTPGGDWSSWPYEHPPSDTCAPNNWPHQKVYDRQRIAYTLGFLNVDPIFREESSTLVRTGPRQKKSLLMIGSSLQALGIDSRDQIYVLDPVHNRLLTARTDEIRPLGDLDGDNNLTVEDVALALGIVVGLTEPDPEVAETLDFDRDGQITVLDVLFLLKIYLAYS